MSFQNNMAKESLSLQNHIVWPCFIFVTQNAPLMHNPDDKPSNWFILFNALQLFSTLTQYMSASHVYSTIDGVEYDGGGLCGEDKKGESLTSTRLINGLSRCPSTDVNARSRDCHATDALEL